MCAVLRWRWPTWIVLANIAVWLVIGYFWLLVPDPKIAAYDEGLAVYAAMMAKVGIYAAGFALAVIVTLIVWSETRPGRS
jgi:hypothetical protein